MSVSHIKSVTTTRGEVDESTLRKTEITFENEDLKNIWIEYCERDCDGEAHRTEKQDSETFFCKKHIHHSVSVLLKKGLSMFPEAGSF